MTRQRMQQAFLIRAQCLSIPDQAERSKPLVVTRGDTHERHRPRLFGERPGCANLLGYRSSLLHFDSPERTQSAKSWRFPSSRLVPAWREGLFRVPGKRPHRPKWHPAFASPAAQTVPENLASVATALLQQPIPLTLRRAGTSATETPPSCAAGWDVATFLLLFCALT